MAEITLKNILIMFEKKYLIKLNFTKEKFGKYHYYQSDSVQCGLTKQVKSPESWPFEANFHLI